MTNIPQSGRWLKRLAWCGGGLALLLVGLYFVIASGAFFKGMILPRIGKALNAEVLVAEVEISPFTRIVLRGVKVTPNGAEPIFTATSVTIRYSPFAILRGHIVVDELVIVSPTVTLIESVNGTGNLNPLSSGKVKPGPAARAASPLSVEVKSVRLDDATVRHVKNLKGGGRETMEMTQVSMSAVNIKKGESGKLDFSAAIAMDKAAGTTGGNNVIQARLRGAFTFQLTQDLTPAAVSGQASLDVDKATGDFADLTTLAAKLDCEITPAKIKQLALTFTKAGAGLGEVRVSGPFDAAKMEGKLKVEVSSLERQALNLAGVAAGIDFGTTTINASNEIELTHGGALITAAGTLDANRFQLTREKQTSPTLDLRCDYNVTVNRREQSALIKTLDLTGAQSQRPLLQAGLSNPMTIAWGDARSVVGDAALNLVVTSLNLADWKAFTGNTAPVGIANLKLKLLSQQGGRQLTFELDGKVDQFSARAGKGPLQPMDVLVLARGKGVDLKQFDLGEYRLELVRQGQSMFVASGAGTFDRITHDADFQVKVRSVLAQVAPLLSQTNVTCSAGTLELAFHVTQQQQTQTVTGQLVLADFTGQYSDYRFASFGTTMDLDIRKKDRQVEICKAAGRLRQGQTDGGSFDLAGHYDLDKKDGQLTAKLVDFKANDLRPFLEPSLGGKQLVSVSLITTTAADFNANGDAMIKADVRLANLVVQDPKNPQPSTPLEMHLVLDADAIKKVVTVRQGHLTLTPTARAKNELQVTGTVDYSNTNGITGRLKFASEALDATACYDLFARTDETMPSQPTPSPMSNATAKEPAAMTLPFRNLICEAAIGRFYLRQVDIMNFRTTVTLDGGHVAIKPCQLTLNGAPVTASVELDLGVPGYGYDIAVNGARIPLAPLVNSFSATYRDRARGELLVGLQVKGSGVTGRQMQQTLAGQITLIVTNANIQVVGPKLKNVLVPIAIVLGSPELLSTPLDYIHADLQLGNGKIETRKFIAHSGALLAESHGAIPIAGVLMDSPLSQPVEVSLPRALASKLRFGNVPVDAEYMKLPTFVHLAGTLGDPSAKTDRAVIIGLTASGIGGTMGGKGGGVLRGIGGILSGQSPAATNAPSVTTTNKPPDGQSAPINLLDLFKKRK